MEDYKMVEQEFDSCLWLNNGYTKQFMWWYVYIDNARKEE